ncbi:MAG: DUF1595 domain-containing protein, partial [Bryobacteraceae bacterium]
MLDASTRQKLDHAWADLYSSFEFHDIFLRFVVEKYKLDLQNKRIAELDRALIESLPAEPRKYVQALYNEYLGVVEAEKLAKGGHVEDCLKFASRAWRRPLTEAEKVRLKSFYTRTLAASEQDHTKAIRSVLSRILVAPAFLYRLEQPLSSAGVKPLTDWEMASRLSYFMWSSM